MRIVTPKSWLLVGLLLAGSAASEPKNRQQRVVEFDLDNRLIQQTAALEGKPAVIWPVAMSASVILRWNIKNATLNAVNLYLNTTEVNSSSTGNVVKESLRLGSGKPPNNTPNMALRQEPAAPPNITILVFVDQNAQGGTIQIDDIRPIIQYNEPSKALKLLYFDAVWEKGGKTGTSYSRFFTAVMDDPTQYWKVNDYLKYNLLTDSELAFPDANPEESNGGGGAIGGGQSPGLGKPTALSTTGSSTTIPAPTSTTSTSSGKSDNTETASPKPQSKTGLSLGAIIGIAIACGLIGLALIGGIIFCCLRRRQKQNALGGGVSRGGMPYGGSGRNGDELMAEKEANAGVLHDVTSAPTSPYSDDGHNHQQHLMGMGGVGTSNRDSGSVVMPHSGPGVSSHGAVLPGVDARLERDGGSPVSNAPSHPVQHDHQSGAGRGDGSPTTLHSGGGAPSLTHGGAGTESNRGSLISQQQQARSLSTPYAHLVEDGMTEEEIRALEEEERQLDVAIEQHVGGRRGSRNR